LIEQLRIGLEFKEYQALVIFNSIEFNFQLNDPNERPKWVPAGTHVGYIRALRDGESSLLF